MPKGLFSERDLKRKVDTLFNDPDYQAMISGIWDPPKTFQDILTHIVGLLSFLLRYNPDVDDRVLAAIWKSWLDKAAIRPDIPVTVTLDQQRASVLILTCYGLRDIESAARKMWSAFLELVAHHHGDRMEEEREREAMRGVGRTIGEIARSKDDLRERANDLLAAVRKGLTEGTAPDDCVVAGYEGTAVETGRASPRGAR